MIEFNDLIVDNIDVERVLIHELSHHISYEINRLAPSHGLLWAASCDALLILMEIDEETYDNEAKWLFTLSKTEIKSTMIRDGVKNRKEWENSRDITRDLLVETLSKYEKPIHYKDVLHSIASCHLKAKNI